MKKILLTVTLLLSCLYASMAQDEGYKIEGRLANTVNGKLLLIADTDKGMIDIGEATVTNGKFEFTGRMTDMTVVYLTPVKKTPVLATIMLENANYTVTIGTNELVVEGGGEAQKVWKEFNDLNKYLLQTQQQMDAQARQNTALIPKLQQEFSKIEKKVLADELELIKKYSNSPVSAYVVAGKMRGMDDTKLAERYDALGEKAKATSYGQRVASELEKVQKLAVGALAPNFSGPLADGGVLVLHETRGKVKIVNFWASWCQPCRQENVNLLKMYKRYRPRGLEIISVSLDDNKQAWLTAIGQDGSDWKNVSDLKGQHSEIAAEYLVTATPTIFILDEENRIIAKNLRGKELEKFVEGMLKKK